MNEVALAQPVGRIHQRGMYQQPYKATDVLCSDGRYRTARITADADTWFSLPASVQVRGRTVSGFLYYDHEALRFSAYSYRRNGHLLPE